MNNIFTRSEKNPILKPNPLNPWEKEKLYNPGAIFHEGKYHLFYRALSHGQDWKSSIGYAVSKDGETFKRFNEPLLFRETEAEKRGLEDPRITRIGKLFYMAYAAYDGITPRLNIATSKDLNRWKKRGAAFKNWNFEEAGGVDIEFNNQGKPCACPRHSEWSKSGGIFPEKIKGKFWMLFGEEEMWFAVSADGLHWIGFETPFLNPRPGKYFDNTFVEMGPTPIKTKKGWLVLYHGVDNKHCYRIGFLLLDLKDPRKILYRSPKPIFEPEKDYEKSGMVDVLPGGITAMEKMSARELKVFLEKKTNTGLMPKVTFCCGATLVGDELRIYYGASDSVICTAVASLKRILDLVEF